MRGSAWLLGMFVAVLATPAPAAELTVVVTDAHTQPVADAVVTVLPRDRAAPARRPAATTHTVDQKDLTFAPYLTVLRTGDEAVFRNSDRTRHHVYSFSPVKAFEFVLAPGESSAPLRMEKSGVVAVGCNIHDQMIGYLYVSDAPWIAQSHADGRVQFHDLPAGSYDVRVWQPRLRPNRPDLAQSTAIVAGGEARTLTFTLNLLPDARLQFDREHTRY